MFETLKANRVNIGALALIALLAFIAYAQKTSNHQLQIWLGFLLGGMLSSFFAATFNYWRILKLSEAAISTIAAAAQGHVEFHGVASTPTKLLTPYHSIPCVWYRAWVYANVNDQGGIPDIWGNRLLEYSVSDQPFSLNDGTASCTINPIGAEVVHFQARTWRKNEHRYVEQYLPANKLLYVIGQLNTLKHLSDVAAHNAEVRHILADWKSRPEQLRNRYDHNWDGKIDADEWELARQDAIKQASANQMMAAHIDGFTLAKPKDRHLFLISAKSPQQLRHNHQIWLLLHISLLILLVVFYLRLS